MADEVTGIITNNNNNGSRENNTRIINPVPVYFSNWKYILSIGFLFGWLLSFPLQGPLVVKLAENHSQNVLALIVFFISGHILGIAGAGLAGYFLPALIRWLSAGVVVCTLLTFFITGLPGEIWNICFGLMGFFAGIAVISWGTGFYRSVKPVLRARTFITAAVIANLVLLLINFIVSYVKLDLLILLTGVLPLGMLFLLLPSRTPVSVLKEPDSNETGGNKSWLARYGVLLPFIFFIYVVGGLSYYSVQNLISPPEKLWLVLGIVPYIILLVPAGVIGDRFGRRTIAFLGAVAAGIGFMSIGIFHGPLQYILAQVLMVGGYAFLDAFTWIIPADLSSPRSVPAVYAAILGTNVAALLTGLLVGSRFGSLTGGFEILTVSLAGLLCFISITLLLRVAETLRFSPAVQLFEPAVLNAALSKLDLTPRESAIAQLLIDGSSTADILAKLSISSNTLKSHLKNIYRKSKVSNRHEFTTALLKNSRTPPGQ